MDGIVKEPGCSDTTDAAGGEANGTSVLGRGDGSTFVSSALEPSSLPLGVVSGPVSDLLESMLVLPVSLVIPGLRIAGLSGREGASDEALESGLSVPLLTAFASRSCKREFGLLREAALDRPKQS